MDDRRGLPIAVFGVFAVLGALVTAIAYVVATQVGGDVRSVFMVVAGISFVLTVLMGYLALATWHEWWPLGKRAIPRNGGFAPED